jgi:hypothetical protein
MKLRPFYTALALAFCSTLFLPAQTGAQTGIQTAKHKPFQPATEQAPGAAPDKVWLNLPTRVYHCPGDRYYGRTKDGKYMTESEAKASGAHGPRGATCFK